MKMMSKLEILLKISTFSNGSYLKGWFKRQIDEVLSQLNDRKSGNSYAFGLMDDESDRTLEGGKEQCHKEEWNK